VEELQTSNDQGAPELWKYLDIEEAQKHEKTVKSAEEEFLFKLALAIKATESKYQDLESKAPLDLIVSFYLERVHCYTSMLRLNAQNPGLFLTLDDIFTLPDEWEKPSEDFWLSLTCRFDRELSRTELESFLSHYALANDPKWVLRLGLSWYWLNVLLDEVDRRAKLDHFDKNGKRLLPFAKDVWVVGVTKAFHDNAEALAPNSYHTAEEPYVSKKAEGQNGRGSGIDDRQVERENRAVEAFKRFISQKEMRASELVSDDYVKRVSSVMIRSLAPDWYENAGSFVENSLKECVEVFYPIIIGELNAAPLAMRTYFLEYYQSYGQVVCKTPKAAKKSLKLHIVSLLKKGEKERLDAVNIIEQREPYALYRADLRFDPEKILIARQKREQRVKELELFQQEEPELFKARLKHGQNIRAIGREINKSHPIIYKRIAQLKQTIADRLRIDPSEVLVQF
jgi:hypothetical protein